MPPRIVLVGAGSHFTLGLFGDIIRVNDLWGSEVILMDIDESKLKVMQKILERIVKDRELDIKISGTTHLEKAVENADYVLLTIRAGGIEVLRDIIEIPLRLGVLEVVGDTVGPSGVLKGLLEIPAILNIANTVKDHAPKAVLINFTNPMTPICRAVKKTLGLQIIGLCHGFNHIRRLASKIFSLKGYKYQFEKLSVDAVGINHLTWTLNLSYEGHSLYNDLLASLEDERFEEVLRNHPYLIGRDLYRVYHVPPTLSDRHTSEFFHYLYDWIEDPRYGPILKRVSMYIDYENKTLRQEIIEREEARSQELKQMARGEKEINIRPSMEYAIDIISAIENNKRIRLLAANIPNEGSVKGISQESIVEVPIEVSRSGISPAGKFRIPRSIMNILNFHLEKYEVMVDGIIERNKDLVVQAIALDPLTPSPAKAEMILKKFLEKCRKRKVCVEIK